VLFVFIFLNGCLNVESDRSENLSGEDFYNQRCLSCHNRNWNTLEKPTLKDMSALTHNSLVSIITKVRGDSLHMQLIVNQSQMDTLIKYIESVQVFDNLP